MQVSGKMRAVMKPLVSQVPIIGAVTVFFLNRPVQLYTCFHDDICSGIYCEHIQLFFGFANFMKLEKNNYVIC